MISDLEKGYESQVYAGVLGKVAGVYMGKPFEGWNRDRIIQHWGMVDRYVHSERHTPLVASDDDISGTFTFVRALEDSGLYRDTTEEVFGRTWLNYLIENRSVIWWGGRGLSTEHTAFLRLKEGIASPRSGSAELNGKTVSEQIGAQIFIDAFGMVAPGEPKLAAELARRAARVAHDGEAVYGAMVVAAMVAAAFSEKNMDRLLDIGASLIPSNSLIATLHRDVRGWAREDGDWQKTFDRIAEKWGYKKYGGGCHIIPNHALMVMAWAYSPEDFRQALAIVNTAGWDTDCNSGNVGCVLGVKLGVAGINRSFDFQSPFADRMTIPSADGPRVVTDCLLEAMRVAKIGRRVMRWAELPAPKAGAWHHFSEPGSRHGYMVEPTSLGTTVPITLDNVAGPNGQRALAVNYRNLAPTLESRVTTPIFLLPAEGTYAVMGTPRLYSGQTVTMSGLAQPGFGTAHPGRGEVTIRLLMRYCVQGEYPFIGSASATALSEPATISGEGTFSISMAVPGDGGMPVTDLGFEITGPAGASGRILIDRVSADRFVDLRIADEIPRSSQWKPLGWTFDMDSYKGKFSNQPWHLSQFSKSAGRGFLVTGTNDWTDYEFTGRFYRHMADRGGLLARFQGLQRNLSLETDGKTLRLILHCYGQTVLGETPCEWPREEFHQLGLTVKGARVTAYLDGKAVLEGSDNKLGSGGAGYFVDSGLAGFRETHVRAI
jgi:ADP-ribosylglycohydrolase